MLPDRGLRQSYQSLYDGLRDSPATLASLINLAEQSPWPFEYGWVFQALETRGLVEMHLPPIDAETGVFLQPGDTVYGWILTQYGVGFVAWLREPRDLPVQLTLFEEDDHAPDT